MRTIVPFAAAALLALPALAAEAPTPPDRDWSFEGPFGTFDRDAARRGFRVYDQVCASCHGLDQLHYRHLYGIGFPMGEIERIAAAREIEDGPDENGDMFFRPARPSDPFVKPFPNKQAAQAANGGAYPPELSLMVKARPDGADYLHGLLIGYVDPPPAGAEVAEGRYYNLYYPGHQIAMPPPLAEGMVDFGAGGPEATVEQMAHDVTVFLAWAASPEMEARKRLGVKALIFLAVLTGFLFALKRRIWSRLD